MATFTYWIDGNDEETQERRRRFVKRDALESTEFELVQEWFPIFFMKGSKPRTEIIRWWKEVYPERATNDKLYTKLNRYIDWWEKHTNMSKGDEEKIVVTREVRIA